jgi:branched-chain amino acid transport system permease protein
MFVILGGINNPWGALIGAAIMTIVPEQIAFLREWRPSVFALTIIVLLLVRPQGLIVRRWSTARLGGASGPTPQPGPGADTPAPLPHGGAS